MNDNAKKWVDALRSGKYKQTTQRLGLEQRDGTKRYCCLGVACEIYADENPDSLVRWKGKELYSREYNSGSLSPEIVKWLGLDDDCGRYTNDRNGYSLSRRNDHGASFEEIADIIESEPEGLFA